MIHYTSSKIITSHYLQFLSKEKKILKKNYKKKTNKKLSSNYIKLKIVCKYARKNKSCEKEKEYTSKSFCLTSLSLNTISLSKVKKMYQKVILHVNRQKSPEQKFFICPPMLSKIKNLYIFFQLCTFNSYCQKIPKKAYLHQIKQIFKKKRSKKILQKVFFPTLHVSNQKKKIYHLIQIVFKKKKSTKNPKSYHLTKHKVHLQEKSEKKSSKKFLSNQHT